MGNGINLLLYSYSNLNNTFFNFLIRNLFQICVFQDTIFSGAYVLVLLYILSVLLPVSLAVDADCNYYSLMAPNTTYYVYNSEYPNYYQPGKICRWVAVAPEDYKINVKCQIDMPEVSKELRSI